MSEGHRRLRWGVASLIEHPMPELAARAREYEALGYTDVWVPDERLLRNVYVSLATIASATTRIGLGPAVTNPYTRHPAHTAAAIATIDELSGGRATLAFGAGGGLDAYGIKRANPVQTLREAVQISQLLTRGETASYQGEVFSLGATQLDFTPVRPVPVYLAARGPKILQLAGEVADGAILGGFAQPDGLRYAMDMVDRGIERAGRDPGDVDVMSWLYVSVDDDPAAARTAVSKMVLASLITSRPILDRIGIELPSALRDRLDAQGCRTTSSTPSPCTARPPRSGSGWTSSATAESTTSHSSCSRPRETRPRRWPGESRWR
jgi:5,10-methylenetetrahydromethanopterin reductase